MCLFTYARTHTHTHWCARQGIYRRRLQRPASLSSSTNAYQLCLRVCLHIFAKRSLVTEATTTAAVAAAICTAILLSAAEQTVAASASASEQSSSSSKRSREARGEAGGCSRPVTRMRCRLLPRVPPLVTRLGVGVKDHSLHRRNQQETNSKQRRRKEAKIAFDARTTTIARCQSARIRQEILIHERRHRATGCRSDESP